MRTPITINGFEFSSKQLSNLDVAAGLAGIGDSITGRPSWVSILEYVANGELQLVRPEWDESIQDWVVKETKPGKWLVIKPDPDSPRLNKKTKSMMEGYTRTMYEWK